MAAVARLGNVRQFGLRELQAATDGFSARHILGKGGFGNVYRGRLADGTTVAVKRLNDPASASGEAQFRTEVEMISLAVHRHLLRLVGFCAAGGERLLVYPYMPNGSVASRLRGTQPASRHVTRAVTVLLLPAFVHRRIARCPPEGGGGPSGLWRIKVRAAMRWSARGGSFPTWRSARLRVPRAEVHARVMGWGGQGGAQYRASQGGVRRGRAAAVLGGAAARGTMAGGCGRAPGRRPLEARARGRHYTTALTICPHPLAPSCHRCRPAAPPPATEQSRHEAQAWVRICAYWPWPGYTLVA